MSYLAWQTGNARRLEVIWMRSMAAFRRKIAAARAAGRPSNYIYQMEDDFDAYRTMVREQRASHRGQLPA